MKRLFLLLFFVIFSLAPEASGARQLLDRVIAVVNDEIITQSELDVLLRPMYEEYKEQYQGQRLMEILNEARQKLLNQLVEDRLVYQEAKDRGIQADETEIETQIRLFRKRFEDETAMEDTLKKEGFTLAEMRERLRRQSMMRYLQDIEIRAKVVVSPGDVEAYFQANVTEFSEEESLKVRSLTVKKSSEARSKGLADEETRDKIQSLRKKILSGENFDELAKVYSEDTLAKNGGLGDWMKRGDMIPVIDQVIFSLGVGEVSSVIETPMGYHLFRVEEERAGSKREFEDVREEILSKLFQRKSEERFREWMTELKRDAYISIR